MAAATRPKPPCSMLPSTSRRVFIGAGRSRHSRSRMNVTFRLPTPELEARFIADSAAAGLIGLAGHRSVGGIRASLYNAVSLEAVRALVQFMHEFQQRL